MNQSDLRECILQILRDQFPREVFRREVDAAIGDRATADDILRAIAYSGDQQMLTWRRVKNEYAYRLTAAGFRHCCGDQLVVPALAGHLLDMLYVDYPHAVSDNDLEGALIAKLGMNEFTQHDYDCAIGYLELAELVKAEQLPRKIGRNNRAYRLSAKGVDVLDGRAEDAGVILAK